jgi:N-acyl homoserine lactone hydrolase
MSNHRRGRGARPAQLPLKRGAPGASVRLHPLLCGTFKGSPRWFEGPQGWKGAPRALGIGVPVRDMLEVPIVAFLVEHPSAGALLVDTGLHPTVAHGGLSRSFGRIAALGFKDLKMRPEQALSAQLQEHGIAPSEIALIVMTHLHVDHAGALEQFPGATVAMSKREWEQFGGALDGYNPAQLDAPVAYRTLDFDTDGVPAAGFEQTLDLFEDGSVRAVHTPGHSPGHLSLILRLAGGEALLTGDAIFTMSALHGEAEPWRIHDRARYRSSLAQLRRYAAEHPDALIVPGHDMQAWRALRPVY